MAIQECKECGATISSKAQNCPQCGAYDPVGEIRRTFGKIVTWFLVLFFSIFFAVFYWWTSL